MLGEYSYGGTPSYIPNLEVKPIYADGTWLEAAWESMEERSKCFSLFFYFFEICFEFSVKNGKINY